MRNWVEWLFQEAARTFQVLTVQLAILRLFVILVKNEPRAACGPGMAAKKAKG